MKIIKNIKNSLGWILTALTLIILFGIVFVGTGLAELSNRFYTELLCVSILAIQMRFFWYNDTEAKVLLEEDIVQAKKTYDTNLDKLQIDIKQLDKCLDELDVENRSTYRDSLIGFHTKENTKPWRYRWIVWRANVKADRIKKLKSTDIMTRGNAVVLYDTTNYMTQEKTSYQLFSGVLSVCVTVVLASIAFEEIRLSPENFFRYALYVWAIFTAMVTTIVYSRKKTRHSIKDHLARLQFILDVYAVWIKKQKEADKKCLQVEQAITPSISKTVTVI